MNTPLPHGSPFLRFSISKPHALGLFIYGGTAAFLLFVLLRGTDPGAQDLANTFSLPGGKYVLGTDHLGRDVAARVTRGALNSLMYASACICGTASIGTFLGMWAAWAGNRVETAILTATDFTMAFPGLLFALFVGGLFKLGAWPVVLSLALTGWAEYCRMGRALTRVIIGRSYVEAGILSGYPSSFLIRKYVLPEILPQITTTASFGMAKTILQISSLNFVGIGLTPPIPELGAMISESLPYVRRHPFVVFPPAVLTSLFVFALILFSGSGDAGKTKRNTFKEGYF
ncbi:MAG: ABC transporter permease [Synergistaceae bacterium]|jgi:ABC-type dipeptide/oligopeptide/nickel transport system permease subunit|nr:ABC transporter permease [Synergistaceae bacterium]